MAEAAEKACCSTFHFQRIFFAINGLTPAEYARRRRLTLAAMELAADKAKVIDVAIKYGYESPDAFTRAFRNLHGVTPTAAREPGVPLTAYPGQFPFPETRVARKGWFRVMACPTALCSRSGAMTEIEWFFTSRL